MKKSGAKNRPPATAEDRRKYEDAWTDMMITIWRDRIERLRVHDTYALYQQIEGDVVRPTDDITSRMVLAEQEAFMFGEEFAGVLVSAISTAEAKGGRTLRDIMWR